MLLGIVLQELLSGVRRPAERERLKALLDPFPMLLADRDAHLLAARISRACRAKGVAAATVDCLIAAQTIASGASLLTADQDFVRIAVHSALRLAQ